MDYLGKVITDFGGIVLRYGVFYGAANDGLIEPVRKRQYPIVGAGGGITSPLPLGAAGAGTGPRHPPAAAPAQTVPPPHQDGPAIHNIVNDEPAPVREWLPVVVQALGAKS